MSFKRIRSAYDHCMGRKDVDGTAMSVLLALAYCENNDSGACFPSYAHLSDLSHLAPSPIKKACKRLKDAGLITWTSGGKRAEGNTSNHYHFLFSVDDRLSTGYQHFAAATPQQGVGLVSQRPDPSVSAALPLVSTGLTLVSQEPSKSESKSEINKKFKSGRASACLQIGSVINNDFVTSMAYSHRLTDLSELREFAKLAMMLCQVEGERELNAFISKMRDKDAGHVRNILAKFAAELKEGQHSGAHNKAAILMSRLDR